jgi:hypothetical protein
MPKSLYRAVDYLLSIIAFPRMPTNRELIYAKALSMLGTDASPNDEANDVYGCVDTIEELYFGLFGRYIGPKKTLSTHILYQYLEESPSFKKVSAPSPGTIIISPTGYGGKNGVANGHVGICGQNDIIMSNDSRTGTFEENYSQAAWKRYYGDKGGYPIHFFDMV